MQCPSCQSPDVQLIKVFAGHNQVNWSPVNGEKDIFGNYKNPKPLHAHACSSCGHVFWNITLAKPADPDQAAQALVDLLESDEEVGEDPAFILADDLDQ